MVNVRYVIGAVPGVIGVICVELLWGITAGFLPDFLPFVPDKTILFFIVVVIGLMGGF